VPRSVINFQTFQNCLKFTSLRYVFFFVQCVIFKCLKIFGQVIMLIEFEIKFKLINFLLLLFELFLFQSKSISDAAYESFWYNMTPTQSRILLFIIVRSQKRLTITAGNIMDLSLEVFTTVSTSP